MDVGILNSPIRCLKLIRTASHHAFILRRLFSSSLQPCEIVDCHRYDPKTIYDSATPVVIKGLVYDWPAVSDVDRKWAELAKLRKRVGKVKVPVEYGGDYMDPATKFYDIDLARLLDSFNVDLKRLESMSHQSEQTQPDNKSFQHIYLAQHSLGDIPVMNDDVTAPDICKTGKGTIYRSNIWFGGVWGTESPCHYDPFHNILCQVVGSKRIVLYGPEQSPNMYPAVGTSQKNTSLINFRNPDLAKFSLFESAQGYEAILEPGDALFIPIKWWHYCKSPGLSCSVNFWWL